MKIVLIIPPSPWLISDTDLPFLGILYISSYLKQYGHEVQICDLSGLSEVDWKIPIGDVYGITGTTPNFIYIKTIVSTLKQREPHKLVVVGGAHATTLPEHVLQNTMADVCVIGEGEKTMAEIAQQMLLSDIKGIVYKQGNQIFYNDKRPLPEDLDKFPYPDLDAIDFYKYGKSQTFKYLLGECLEGVAMTSRGCPYNCSFCASYYINGGKVRYHSIERIVNEIKMMVKKYGVKLIYFVDDTFVVNRKRILDICEAIKGIRVHWHCLNRVDCCYPDVLKAMKDSGCLQVVIGFESGSNKML